MTSSRVCLVLAVWLAGSGGVRSEGPAGPPDPLHWIGADGQSVAFASDQELANYFQTAKILETKTLDTGITRPMKLLLEKDGTRMHAQFQAHDEYKSRALLGDGTVAYKYRDTYAFNIAAYNLSSLLGLSVVPPSFERKIDGEPGSVTVWLEDTFTDRSRIDDGLEPPDRDFWDRQMARMTVFDELIANDDRNHLNILIDEGWNVWLIDHTRSFRARKELEDPAAITACERGFWAALQDVSDDDLRASVQPWLRGSELKALLARRKALIEHITALIKTQGEAATLYDLP